MILRMLRLIFTPALKLPIFRHHIGVAMPSYLAGFHCSLVKEGPEAVPHGAGKTKAGQHLTIRPGVEPDFVDQFVFHWDVLVQESPCRKRRKGPVTVSRGYAASASQIDGLDRHLGMISIHLNRRPQMPSSSCPPRHRAVSSARTSKTQSGRPAGSAHHHLEALESGLFGMIEETQYPPSCPSQLRTDQIEPRSTAGRRRLALPNEERDEARGNSIVRK